MDVAVGNLTAAVVRLKREPPHAVALNQHLEHIQLELLELRVAMRRLAKGNHACLLGDGDVINGPRVLGKLSRVGTLACPEAPKV